MRRKILYITGTRADYGLIRSVLRKIDQHPDMSIDIVVTGMHLMDEFGNTIDEIQKDGFHCHIVDVQYENDTKESMAIFIGSVYSTTHSCCKYSSPRYHSRSWRS